MLKKESREGLLKIFTQEGKLYEWATERGIVLEYIDMSILPEEEIKAGDEDESPALIMGLHLKEVRKGNETEIKIKITRKLREYLEGRFPVEHQQIHAHIMSINARALVGVLYLPGLLDNEIKHIVDGKYEGEKGEEVGKRDKTSTNDTKGRNETEDVNNGNVTEAGTGVGKAKEQHKLTFESKTKVESKGNESNTISGEGSPMKSLTRTQDGGYTIRLRGMEKTPMEVKKNGYIL